MQLKMDEEENTEISEDIPEEIEETEEDLAKE